MKITFLQKRRINKIIDYEKVIKKTKEQCKKEIYKKLYSSKQSLILTPKEIKRISNCFKKNQNKGLSFEEFLKENPRIKRLILKSKAIEAEIRKQLKIGKALQSGTLFECVISETLARIFGLTDFIDLRKTSKDKIPENIKKIARNSKISITHLLKGRYLFFSKINDDMFLTLYGGSNVDFDSYIVYNGYTFFNEIKEKKAKLREYDLTVNSFGKFLPSKKMKEENPLFLKILKDYNKSICFFDNLGSNYKLDKKGDYNEIIQNYFRKNLIDFVLTAVDDNLVIINPEDFTKTLKNGKKIVSTKGSEIRGTGKNKGPLSTKENFNKSIEDYITKTNDGIYKLNKIDKKGYGYVKGRGTNNYSKYKMNYIYSVSMKKIIKDDGKYIYFNIKDVKETKPTISIHIEIIATWEELAKFYLEKYSN